MGSVQICASPTREPPTGCVAAPRQSWKPRPSTSPTATLNPIEACGPPTTSPGLARASRASSSRARITEMHGSPGWPSTCVRASRASSRGPSARTSADQEQHRRDGDARDGAASSPRCRSPLDTAATADCPAMRPTPAAIQLQYQTRVRRASSSIAATMGVSRCSQARGSCASARGCQQHRHGEPPRDRLASRPTLEQRVRFLRHRRRRDGREGREEPLTLDLGHAAALRSSCRAATEAPSARASSASFALPRSSPPGLGRCASVIARSASRAIAGHAASRCAGSSARVARPSASSTSARGEPRERAQRQGSPRARREEREHRGGPGKGRRGSRARRELGERRALEEARDRPDEPRAIHGERRQVEHDLRVQPRRHAAQLRPRLEARGDLDARGTSRSQPTRRRACPSARRRARARTRSGATARL